MSVDENVRKIRKAVYGAEVRESIANALEEIYRDASVNGNANMEVIYAREGFNSLRDRLNNQVLNMNNLGQDVREAITGGAVAVVGVNSIDKNNFTPGFRKEFSQMNTNLCDVADKLIAFKYNTLVQKINSAGGFTADLKGAIKLISAKNNTEKDVANLNISNNVNNISLQLYPNDYLNSKAKKIYRYWDKFNLSSVPLDGITFQSNDIYAIIKFPNFDITNYDCYVSTQNIISTSNKFVGECQLNYADVRETQCFIGTKSDEVGSDIVNYLCMNILKADVISSGFTWNTEGIKLYIQSLSDFIFYVRRKSPFTEDFYNFNLFIEADDSINVLNTNTTFNAEYYANVIDNIFEDSECKYYQCEVKKPFDADFVNVPVGIKVKFNKGECTSLNCIEVYKQTEVEREGTTTNGETTPQFTQLDFQFENDKNAHDDSIDLGKYADGSIQAGTIWVKDTLGNKNLYFIKIYDKEQNNTYTSRVLPVQSGTDITISYSDEGAKYLFNKYMGYNLRSIYIGDTCLNNVNLAFRPSIKNSNSTDINLSGETASNTSFKIEGNGVIYIDLIARNQFNYNTDIESITKYRIWFNGQLDINSVIKINNKLVANTITGVNFKFLWDGTNNKPTKLEVGTLYDNDRKCLGILKSTEISPEYPDKNAYTTNILVGYDTNSSVKARRIYCYWQDENLVIPKGSRFGAWYSFKYDSSLTNDNAKVEGWKILNPIYSRASKLNEQELKNKLQNKLANYLEYMLKKVMNFNYNNTGHTLFPGAEVFLYLGYMKTHNVDLWDKLENSKNYLFTTRWGGATTGDVLFNRWKNKTNSYVGIEWFGRDSAMLPYLYQAYKDKGDDTKASEVLKLLEACADLFINIEAYYGSNGSLCLTVDETGCNTNAQSAAFKCLTKAIKLMPDNSKVSTWTTVKNRIIAKYLTLLRFGTIIPHTNTSDSSTYQPQFHYEAFPAMDYVISVNTLEYNPEARLFEAITPSGSCKEFYYNYHRKRKGFAHTLLYSAATHALIGGISGMAEANQILDFLISRCYPVGYHQYPLDGWGNEDSSYANFPIECQVVSELLFELEG